MVKGTDLTNISDKAFGKTQWVTQHCTAYLGARVWASEHRCWVQMFRSSSPGSAAQTSYMSLKSLLISSSAKWK